MGVKVRERNGGWWVFIDHKGRRRAKRCASKKAAQIAADKIDAALRLGQVGVLDDERPVAKVPTFGEYATTWMATAAQTRLRPATIDQYQVRLRLRLLPTLGPLPLTSITRETIRTLVGVSIRGGTVATVNRSRGTARSSIR
jgi:hypothetical protein